MGGGLLKSGYGL